MPDALLQEFRTLARSLSNRYVEAWRAEGRPIVGYFCPYMPPELILAVGALPFRLRGTTSPDSAAGDAMMSGKVCTYVRHVMSLALEGDYGFLDGAICLNTCDHVRRAADVFRAKVDLRFHGFLSVPRNPRESLYPFYLEELRRLYGELAEAFGVETGDDALREAIAAMNANRKRLHRLNRLRMEPQPRLSGAESLAIHVASQSLPPEALADLLDRLLEGLAEGRALDSERARLLLIGAELDDPDFVDVLESQGALVVADRLCFGARSVLYPIDEDADDPLDAIGRGTFFRSSCARMMGKFPSRFEATRRLLQQARADGIIFARLMFCDPWGGDLHNFLHRAKKIDLPILPLTREYGVIPTGQLRTRVQAFVEKLEIARARREAEAAS